MSPEQSNEPQQPSSTTDAIPDRLCTWCKVTMIKRLVGGGAYVHYTCPKCIFQHTSKRQKA